MFQRDPPSGACIPVRRPALPQPRHCPDGRPCKLAKYATTEMPYRHDVPSNKQIQSRRQELLSNIEQPTGATKRCNPIAIKILRPP